MLLFLLATALADEGSDSEFIEAVFLRNKKILLNIAAKYHLQKADLEDIENETAMKLLNNISEIRGLDERSMATYLMKTTRSVAIDFLRAHRRERELIMLVADEDLERIADTVTTEDRVLWQEEMRTTIRKIRKLPDRERHVLYMKFALDKTTAEIAEALETTESAVRALLFRARQHLIDLLREEEDGNE